MMRAICLACLVLSLGGCFLFNNHYEYAAQFQIIIQGSPYAGTYIWNPSDNAYEAMVSSEPCKVYMDASSGLWYFLENSNQIADTYSPGFRALPPTATPPWSSIYTISIDDSAAGISAQGFPPDTPISQSGTPNLQVTFQPSAQGNTATYQWVRSDAQAGSGLTSVGTGPTYVLQLADVTKWIRVIVTPADGTGKTQGAPVTSPPVHVGS